MPLLRVKTPLSLALSLGLSLIASSASAATYEVGPGKTYATIQETLDLLAPGDLVLVDGDVDYPGDIWFRTSGTPNNPITIRGLKKDGKRPRISGIGSEQWHDMIVLFYATDLVFESFEIIGDPNPDHFGLVHKGHNITLRDLVVRDVAGQGLLGTDSESGSLTLESSEFFNNGDGLYQHQIYMATDESMYPGAVFRMQHCYVHNAAGGNNVKSRAERNEIYHNWIEGAVFHELDLVGPDGQDEGLAREDSDVVGNVFVKTSEWRIARIGGDGTGNTSGRYRFVNNTMVLGSQSDVAIGMQQTVESVEFANNVVWRQGGEDFELFSHLEPEGSPPQIFGSNNWLHDVASAVPSGLDASLSGSDPGFVNMATFDLRPAEGSSLLDAGNDVPAGSPALEGPLLLPTHVPPARALGTGSDRKSQGVVDIGAFELGSGEPPGPGGGGGSGAGGAGADDGDGAADGDEGCSCRQAGSSTSGHTLGALALLALVGLGRRRRSRLS